MYNFNASLILKNGKKVTIFADNHIKVRPETIKGNNIISFNDTRTSMSIDDKTFNSNFDPKQIYLDLIGDNLWYNSTFIRHGIPQNFVFVDTPFSIELNRLGWAEMDLFSYIDDIEVSLFSKSILSQFLQPSFDDRELDNNLINAKIKDAFNRIGTVLTPLKKLSPICDIRLNENYNVFFNNDKRTFSIQNLFYEFLVEGNWHPFSNLSDGTKRLFYIVAEVSLAGESFFSKFGTFHQNDINANRIILIEEPELGIHPHQLNALMLFLKEQSKKKQIIITTHSPQVLDILNKDELGNIIIASYEKNKGTLLRHLDEGEIAKAQQYMEEDYLSDYWRFSDLEKVKI